MCLPAATLGQLSTGMQVAGVVTGAFGAYNTSKATKTAYETQAAVARNNAQYAEWQARDAIRRGQEAEGAHRLKVAQLKGSQRARLAANGVVLDEGSALNILADTDFMGENDALTIRDNASREAWALRRQAAGFEADAGLLSTRAKDESPLFAAGSTLLTGAGQVAASWYKRKQAGF